MSNEKYKKLFERINDYYDRRIKFLGSKVKLMYLTTEKNLGPLIILGKYSPSGDNMDYWDIIESDEGCNWYITTYPNYLSSIKFEKHKKGNRLLEYLQKYEYKFARFIELKISNLIKECKNE